MQEDTTANPGPVALGTRCVVWVPSGKAAPADLLGGLSRRGVRVVVVIEPAGVMVELARQATGMLVVVEPQSHPYLSELIRAVKSYYPKTVRWCYQAKSGEGQLCKLNGQANAVANGALPTAQANPQAGEASQGNPLGRVHRSGPHDRVRSLVVKVEAPDGLGEPLISEEELAMLLGPAPEDAEGET